MTDISANPERSNGNDSAASDGDERHAVQTYVSDMLALERHIAEPLKHQTGDAGDASGSAALALTAQIRSTCEAHVVALTACLAQLGGHEASGVKSAWSSLLGVGAAAIDGVRKTKVSKNLRDDYAALSLASISYTMLHATAVGIGDTAVAELAVRHLADYARAVMQIAQVMPVVVLSELREDGQDVQTNAAELVRQQTNDVWKSQAEVTA